MKAVIRKRDEELRLTRMERDAHKKIEGVGTFFVQSLISHRTQKPRVDMQVGDIHTQMSADAAMDVAKNIIECCEGAYADAFIFHFIREKIGQTDQVAAQIIQDFRAYRDELTREFKAENTGNDQM